MHIGILSAFMLMNLILAWWPWNPEEGIRIPELGLHMILSHHAGARNWVQALVRAVSLFKR